MTERRRIVVKGFDAIVVKAVELVGTVPGASSFELKYDAADRVLGEDEEPRPDEAVAWTASAELRRKYAKGTKPVVRTIIRPVPVKVLPLSGLGRTRPDGVTPAQDVAGCTLRTRGRALWLSLVEETQS